MTVFIIMEYISPLYSPNEQVIFIWLTVAFLLRFFSFVNFTTGTHPKESFVSSLTGKGKGHISRNCVAQL